VRINVCKLNKGQGILSALTFIVSDQHEQKKFIDPSRMYKIIGEFLVWKDRDGDFFNFVRLFDQKISLLEAEKSYIELKVY